MTVTQFPATMTTLDQSSEASVKGDPAPTELATQERNSRITNGNHREEGKDSAAGLEKTLSKRPDNDSQVDKSNVTEANNTFLTPVLEDDEEEECEEVDSKVNEQHKPRQENVDPDEVPVFRYSRVYGSIPRQQHTSAPENDADVPGFESRRSCSVFGSVVLTPETTLNNSNPSTLTDDPAQASLSPTPSMGHASTSSTDRWSRQSFPLVAHGTETGEVWLVEATTGVSVTGQMPFQVRGDQPPLGSWKSSDQSPPAVSSVSMDASGTVLAAVSDDGMCTVWEMRFGIQQMPAVQQGEGAINNTSLAPQAFDTNANAQPNVFASFVSAIMQQPSQLNMTRRLTSDNPDSPALVPTLVAGSIQTHRQTYSASFGRPTCFAVDPAYRRKREKSVIIGFSDGRLLCSKRGFFQRRVDAVLYQAVPTDDSSTKGILSLSWRGNLVAWADASGIRLLDSDSWQRLCHVDRPVGGKPSLYPSLRAVLPTLCWETSTRLLVAWGDCLLSLDATEQQQSTPPVEISLSPGTNIGGDAVSIPQQPRPQQRRKHVVLCTMAWELDCVACGAVPLDEDHVLVLGLLLPFANNEEEKVRRPISEGVNELELQVISRADGQVVWADLLALATDHQSAQSTNGSAPQRVALKDATSDFQLLSSFVTPRMDDLSERQDAAANRSSAVDDPTTPSIFGGSSRHGLPPVNNPHLVWSFPKTPASSSGLDGWHRPGSIPVTTSDDASLDSDDYEFVLRPATAATGVIPSKLTVPPVIWVASSCDAVVAETRTVDDMISQALERKHYATALHRGLVFRQLLRQYTLEQLVNEYLKSLLRLQNDSNVNPSIPALSMRRMVLAAKAMPRLIGANVQTWEYWTEKLEKLPGALFVMRDCLPVRDPKLKPEIYARLLSQMMLQIEEMRASENTNPRHITQAEEQYLVTLLTWGTTHVLHEFASHYAELATGENIPSAVSRLHDILITAVERREYQSSDVFLRFTPDTDTSHKDLLFKCSKNTHDSLFNTEEVTYAIESLVSKNQEGIGNTNCVALEALAILSMMSGRYEDALRHYLSVGSLLATHSVDSLEDEAIKITSKAAGDEQRAKAEFSPYSFVVRLVERHHLHQCLLDRDYLPASFQCTTLMALARLVGLPLLGDFLISHCVAPQRETLSSSSGGKTDDNLTLSESESMEEVDELPKERRGTLPLDLIARELESFPRLLFWYLCTVYVHRPELYVVFPSTSVPPETITDLHQRHIAMHIEYAEKNRDSAKVLKRVESYRATDFTTPLLSLLKVCILHSVEPLIFSYVVIALNHFARLCLMLEEYTFIGRRFS